MRLLAWLASALILPIVLVAAYLQFADLKAEAEWVSATFLQRELTIDGQLEFDLVPEPRLLVERVTFANAPWGSQPVMLRVGHLSARVDPWSLFSGPLRLHELRAEDVNVVVETSADGTSNWALLEAGDGEEPPGLRPVSAGGFHLPVVFEHLEIKGLEVVMETPESPRRVFAIETAVMTLEADQRQNLSLAGNLIDMPIDLEGSIESALTDSASADAFELELTGSLGPLSMDIEGALGTGETVTATISSDDPSTLLKRLSPGLPLEGPLKVDARIHGKPGGLGIEADTVAGALDVSWQADLTRDSVSLNATVRDLQKIGASFNIAGMPSKDLEVSMQVFVDDDALRFENGRAAIDGAAATFDATLANGTITADVNARGPSLADLGFNLPAAPFVVTFTAARSGDVLQIDPFSARLGDGDLAGTLRIDTGEHLKVIGRLESELLDLTPFLPQRAATAESTGQAVTTKQSGGGTPGRDRLFDREPLAFDVLETANVDLELRVARFLQGDLKLDDLKITADVDSGNLTGEFEMRGPDDSTMRGRLKLETSERPARLTVNARAEDMRVNLMSGDAELAQIPPIGVSVNIDASGNSPHELAATSTGRVLFHQGPGRISNSSATWLTSDLLTQLVNSLNPFAKQEPYTNLDCVVTLVVLEDGLGKMPVMLLQTDKVKVIGNGTIDLEAERFDIEFNTQPRKGIGVSVDMFVTPFVTVSGPLTSPGIGLNKKGVLLKGGAAVLTGGLSIAAEALFDRASGGRDRCALALEAARGTPSAHP